MVNISKSSIIYQYRSTTDRSTCQNVYPSTYQIVDMSSCSPSGCLHVDLSDHRLANLPTIFTCQPVDMSTGQSVDLSTYRYVNLSTYQTVNKYPIYQQQNSICHKSYRGYRRHAAIVLPDKYVDNNSESLRKII